MNVHCHSQLFTMWLLLPVVPVATLILVIPILTSNLASEGFVEQEASVGFVAFRFA